MKNIKILFQGDSITDANRIREDFYDLGEGYAKYAAQLLSKKYKNVQFEFINKGIGGNQTKDLVDRLQTDFIDINPDIISVLIGINDTWHHAENKDWLDNDLFELRYRTILSAIKEKTDAKIMVIDPFLIPVEDKLFFREDLSPKIDIVRKLAIEYADSYMPIDGLLNSAFVNEEPISFAEDGVHPTAKGAEFIANYYVEYISKIIDDFLR